MVTMAVPLQPMEVNGGADLHLQPVERTHAGAVHEELQPVGRTHIGEVCGELSPMGGTSRWSRGRCFKVWFYFSVSYSDLIGDELNFLLSPSSVCFVRDIVHGGGGVTEWFWWAPGISPSQTKPGK